MNLKRTATFGIIGGALAAWLAAAATSNRHENLTPFEIKTRAIDSRGAELAAEIRRLHERLHPDAAPRQPGRNLFEFTAPRPNIARIDTPPALSEAAPSTTQPTLKLSGLAEDPGPDGSIVRTAIISGPGQLFLAKEGELVTGRYRVVRISSDGVELVDLVDDSTLRLVLK
jgi:hypothetical protein